MHSLLTSYLSEVAAHLRPMPIKQRNEELREVRSHLENAVIISRELGQTEEDAAANAVTQFGTAEDLGGNLVWAWRRERSLSRRSFWGAVIFTSALVYIMPILVSMIMGKTIYTFELTMRRTYHWSHLLLLAFFYWPVNFLMYSLIGAGIGRLFPRRAVLGTSLSMGVWVADWMFHLFYWNGQIYWPSKIIYGPLTSATDFTGKDVVRLFTTYALQALIVVASAAFTSRNLLTTKQPRLCETKWKEINNA